MSDPLLTLGVKTVAAAIDELLELRRRVTVAGEAGIVGENPAVPLVTLHLRSGRDVRGHLLAGGSASRGPALLLHVPGDSRGGPDDDVLYVDPAAVEALTVHGAGRLARALRLAEPPPSRLAVQRRAQELSQSISDRLGVPVAVEVPSGASGEALRSLLASIEDTVAVLHEIEKEEAGRQALRQLRKLRFDDAEPPAITRDGTTLSVTAALGRGEAGRLPRAQLKALIQATF